MSDKNERSAGDESIEAAIVRRRNLLKKSVILGVPLFVTLPGRALAQGGTNSSVTQSEQMSRRP